MAAHLRQLSHSSSFSSPSPLNVAHLPSPSALYLAPKNQALSRALRLSLQSPPQSPLPDPSTSLTLVAVASIVAAAYHNNNPSLLRPPVPSLSQPLTPSDLPPSLLRHFTVAFSATIVALLHPSLYITFTLNFDNNDGRSTCILRYTTPNQLNWYSLMG